MDDSYGKAYKAHRHRYRNSGVQYIAFALTLAPSSLRVCCTVALLPLLDLRLSRIYSFFLLFFLSLIIILVVSPTMASKAAVK
tara:strand:+ start:272 stop:520 length:249 start_codon:yes stop_codon:yes gene_type:complete